MFEKDFIVIGNSTIIVVTTYLAQRYFHQVRSCRSVSLKKQPNKYVLTSMLTNHSCIVMYIP